MLAKEVLSIPGDLLTKRVGRRGYCESHTRKREKDCLYSTEYRTERMGRENKLSRFQEGGEIKEDGPNLLRENGAAL